MTKMIALAAALIAGTTMTSVANADGVRLGFGFPLGSFVAHSAEHFSDNDYRRSERPRYVRHNDEEEAPARRVAKVKRPSQDDVAQAPAAPVKVAAQTKEDALTSDPATTTVIEKTPAAKGDTAPVNTAATGSDDTKTEVKTDKIATADKPVETETAKTEAAQPEAAHVCRRFSPAIAALVDVPCE